MTKIPETALSLGCTVVSAQHSIVPVGRHASHKQHTTVCSPLPCSCPFMSHPAHKAGVRPAEPQQAGEALMGSFVRGPSKGCVGQILWYQPAKQMCASRPACSDCVLGQGLEWK